MNDYLNKNNHWTKDFWLGTGALNMWQGALPTVGQCCNNKTSNENKLLKYKNQL